MRTNLKDSEIHPRKKPRSRSKKVEAKEVNKEVWATALEICKGDKSRIEIIDESTVIVHNQGKRVGK